MKACTPGFAIPPGSRIHLHQAFRRCPYAGMVSSRVHAYLLETGHTIVDRPEDADVHLVNSCGSDARQAARTHEALDRVAAVGGERTVAVLGCLVSIEASGVAAALGRFDRSARLDPRSLDRLDELFAQPTVPFADVQPSLHNEYVGNEFSEGWTHVLASTG